MAGSLLRRICESKQRQDEPFRPSLWWGGVCVCYLEALSAGTWVSAVCFAVELKATFPTFHYINSGIHFFIPARMGISLSGSCSHCGNAADHSSCTNADLTLCFNVQCRWSGTFSELCPAEELNKSVTLKATLTLQPHRTHPACYEEQIVLWTAEEAPHTF